MSTEWFTKKLENQISLYYKSPSLSAASSVVRKMRILCLCLLTCNLHLEFKSFLWWEAIPSSKGIKQASGTYTSLTLWQNLHISPPLLWVLKMDSFNSKITHNRNFHTQRRCLWYLRILQVHRWSMYQSNDNYLQRKSLLLVNISINNLSQRNCNANANYVRLKNIFLVSKSKFSHFISV